MPQYQYAVYNNQFPDAVQANMDQMSEAGWHIHTAALAYTELYVVWERDGSSLANRVKAHLGLGDGESVPVQVTAPVEVTPAEAAPKSDPPSPGDA